MVDNGRKQMKVSRENEVIDVETQDIQFENQAISLLDKLEPVHIKIASKIIAKVRFPKYRTSSLS